MRLTSDLYHDLLIETVCMCIQGDQIVDPYVCLMIRVD